MRSRAERGLLPFAEAGRPAPLDGDGLCRVLRGFDAFGTTTREHTGSAGVPVFTGEFWTARQRQASSMHEGSYRACFKPQLPRFFIERLTRPGDRVYDPFLGRGTTLIEAALYGRRAAGCDVNPLSAVLCAPRLRPPTLAQVERRLAQVPWAAAAAAPLDDDLLAFFHPDTLRQLLALRSWLLARAPLDDVDAWIQMVAVNRLTGHSKGFFSVYTLPPNQATSAAAQRRINDKRRQQPEPREVAPRIVARSRRLLGSVTAADRAALAAADPVLLCGAAHEASAALDDGSVDLVVTSPPFLDVVQYALDNWLRGWFCGVDTAAVAITMARTVEAWQDAMAPVFAELHRLLRRGGFCAFEVGEVAKGRVRLEDAVLPVAAASGLQPVCVQIQEQRFTKTANCWGVDNNRHGTNTNRIVVLRRP